MIHRISQYLKWCLSRIIYIPYTFSLLFFFLFPPLLTAQNFWQDANERDLITNGDRRIVPKAARFLQVDADALREQLWAIPHEADIDPANSPATLSLPMPNGETATFRLVAYDISEAAGLDRFPDIRTWYGFNEANPRQTIFLDWTERGFHASVRFGEEEAYFIDPLYRGELGFYQSYYIKDFTGAKDFSCSIDDYNVPTDSIVTPTGVGRSAGDCDLREYITAIAATAEYSNYHGASSASQSGLVQSAIVTTTNRLNQVMTRDLALRLTLIGNNDDVYYYNTSTDPYTGTSAGALLNENTPNLNSVLGTGSYDLGHVFSAGFNSGVAYLRSTCGGNRGGGVTGRTTPENDPFDIDYVAHEMGHQLGGNHTQNNNCNYSSSAGMEPGSAATIMGYAGICSPNIQSNSDDYYHGRSIAEITAHVEQGSGNNCASVISTVLNNPTVTPQQDYTIPQGTPFRLTSTATGNGTLSYCWEQYDPERGAVMPPIGTNIQGPLFRSFDPVASPTRYFPVMSAVVAGTDPTWEELPTVSRLMDFRVTVRNYNATYGCAGEDDLRLTVDGNLGPFVVTDPTENTQLSANQLAQVQWDVAGTDAAPINSNLVDILVSLDGGQNFTLLASDLPNNGLALVTIPSVVSTNNNARMMVRSSDNVFYNIGGFDFTIVPDTGTPTVTLTTLGPSSVSNCFTTDGSTTFQFQTTSSGGANEPINFTVSELPNGATATFFPNPVQPGGTTTLTIGDLDQIAAGTYDIGVAGSSSEASIFAQVSVTKTGGGSSPGPGLISPAPNATDQDLRPTFEVFNNGADTYQYQLATDPAYNNLIFNSTVADPTMPTSEYLTGNTTYYWRVRSSFSSCSVSNWSTGNFTTGDCYIYNSTAAPVPISSGPPPVQATMDVFVEDFGTVADIDLYQLNISHTYVRDLRVNLIAPDGSRAMLLDRECGSQNNIFISIDDEAIQTSLPCPPVNPSMFVTSPSEALAGLDNEAINGNWTIEVNDLANQDGGSLNSFSLKICIDNFVPLPVELLSFTARPVDDAFIRLDWETIQEEDNQGFYVERALATSNTSDPRWQSLGFVPASGTSSGRYTFDDRTAQKGQTYYYRLRQTDVDGQIEYSPVRSASLGDATAANSLILAPNPTQDFVRYNWLRAQERDQDYQLINLQGQLLATGQLFSSGGSINLSDFPAGMYFIRIGSEVYRLVKE